MEQSAFAEEEATGAERLERSLAAIVDPFEELRPFLIAFVEAFPPAVRSPELRGRMARAYADVRAAGAEMVLRSVEVEGLALSREHAETLSAVVTAVCDGLILQWLLDPERVPSSAEIVAALGAVSPAVRLRGDGGASPGRRATRP